MNTFICDDCKKELPVEVKIEDYDICRDCLRDYPNETGYCSAYCRISGECDESC